MATTKRFEAVEILASNGSLRWYFPDLPNLRNALIDRFDVYPISVINPSILTGNVPADEIDLQLTNITFYAGDNQILYNVPLTTFIFQVSNGENASSYQNLPLEWNGQIISWTKSYISTPYALDSSNPTFSFGVFYHF